MHKIAKNSFAFPRNNMKWHHRYFKFDIINGILSIYKKSGNASRPYKQFNLSKNNILIVPLKPNVEVKHRRNIIFIKEDNKCNNSNNNKSHEPKTILTLSCRSEGIFHSWLQSFSDCHVINNFFYEA